MLTQKYVRTFDVGFDHVSKYRARLMSSGISGIPTQDPELRSSASVPAIQTDSHDRIHDPLGISKHSSLPPEVKVVVNSHLLISPSPIFAFKARGQP